jgi:hypothetical protein
MGTRVKGPGAEADHLLPASSGVNSTQSYTPTSPYILMTWCLIKRRDNFTFILWYWDCHHELRFKYEVMYFFSSKPKIAHQWEEVLLRNQEVSGRNSDPEIG